MSIENALDLSSIDPPIWRIMVDKAVYGPYTLGQMKAFAEEGRLTDVSRVASGDGGAFISTFEHAELRSLIPGYDRTAQSDLAPDPANYFVTLQTDGDGRGAVISVLNEAGRFAEMMPGSFILHTDMTVRDLREKLSAVLAERGRFIIVNANTGQLAWMGLTDDANAHAKLIWKRDA